MKCLELRHLHVYIDEMKGMNVVSSFVTLVQIQIQNDITKTATTSGYGRPSTEPEDTSRTRHRGRFALQTNPGTAVR
jgi:hypothetical protein